MATYKERNGKIVAQVWIKPLPRRGKTFDTMDDACAWAASTEEALRTTRATGQPAPPHMDSRFPDSAEAVQALPRLSTAQTFCGIYFLFCRGACIYVGQSIQIHVRVQEHRTRVGYTKDFDSYSWVLCPLERLDQMERFYVDLLKPELNVMLTPAHAESRRQWHAAQREVRRQSRRAAESTS